MELLGSVALLNKACHWRCIWGLSEARVKSSASLPPSCLWIRVCTSQLPLSTSRLTAYHHSSHHADNRLHCWTCQQAPIKCFPLRVAMVTVSVHNSKTLQCSSGFVFHLLTICTPFSIGYLFFDDQFYIYIYIKDHPSIRCRVSEKKYFPILKSPTITVWNSTYYLI